MYSSVQFNNGARILASHLSVQDETLVTLNHFFLWIFSIALLVPCEHQKGNPVSSPRDSRGPASSQCWRDQELPGGWVDSRSGRNAKKKEEHQITNLSMRFIFWLCKVQYFLLYIVKGNILS